MSILVLKGVIRVSAQPFWARKWLNILSDRVFQRNVVLTFHFMSVCVTPWIEKGAGFLAQNGYEVFPSSLFISWIHLLGPYCVFYVWIYIVQMGGICMKKGESGHFWPHFRYELSGPFMCKTLDIQLNPAFLTSKIGQRPVQSCFCRACCIL